MNKLSKHHIIPKSKGGKNKKHNIAFVTQREHERYHSLFSNKTPQEILRWLTTYFWNGDKRFLMEVAKEYNHEET